MAKHNSLWFASCSRLYRNRDLSGGGIEVREEEGERQKEEEEYSFILTLFPVSNTKLVHREEPNGMRLRTVCQ